MNIFRVAFFILFSAALLFPQNADTLITPGNNSAARDSVSVLPDSLKPKKSYDVDTTIFANSSDSLIFFVRDRKMNLYGDSKLDYKDTHLQSANIKIDFETNNVEATGIPSDSLPGKMVNTPVLSDKGEEYKGISMKYNFKNMRGFITKAGTEMEGAYYTGSKIKKMDKDTYFIEDGIYTTCNEEHPHYYFFANKMKVIQKDEVIAKWVWLYFGGVPFPVPIPFAVFPIQSGRRSGIIAPAFGSDATYGYYFSRFGYFWAINDYVDWNIRSDYFTRGSYRLNSRFRYTERYNYSGSVEAEYSHFRNGELTDRDVSDKNEWRLRLNHNQTFTPTLRLDANLDFMSNNYISQNVADQRELLTNDITSNATLFKSWDESGNSLSLSYSRRQSLTTGDIYEVLPNLNFNMAQKYPFRRKDAVGDLHWYELLGVNYSGQFLNNRNKVDGDLSIRAGVQHAASINFAPKLGYFSITPSLSYKELWYNKRIEKHFENINGRDTLVTNDVSEINMVRSFNTGVSLKTNFYGMFQPNVFGIAAIRHTVTPTVSYTYSPDFSRPFWGYYATYKDTTGKDVKYSKYEREVFGSPSGQEQQAISFGLQNVFEMKTMVDPTDTTSKEEKIRLLTLNANMSYNFAADSFKVSDLSLSASTQIGSLLSLNSSANFTPYVYENGREVNRFLINEGGFLRMTNLNFSISTSLSGDRLKQDDKTEEEKKLDSLYYQEQNGTQVYQGIYDENKRADFSIPWDISLALTYNIDKSNPASTKIYSTLGGGFNFNLTPTWKFSFNGSYDFRAKELAAPQIQISKDLHCWTMNFTWMPMGSWRGYMFEIRVKAPQLQDLKVTKRDGFLNGR